MQSIYKVMIILIAALFLFEQHIPYVASPLAVAEEKPVKLETDDIEEINVDDGFELTVKKTDKTVISSSIQLPADTVVDEKKIDHPKNIEAGIDEDKDRLEIEWDTAETTSEVIVPIEVTDEDQELEITSEDKTEDETFESNTIHITVNPDEDAEDDNEQDGQDSEEKEDEDDNDDSDDEVKKDEDKKNGDDDSDKEQKEDAKEKEETSGKAEENEKDIEDEDAESKDEEESDKEKEDGDEEKGESDEKEDAPDSEDKTDDKDKEEESDDGIDDKKAKAEKSSIKKQDNDDEENQKSVKVNDWGSFVDALEDGDVTDIQVTTQISANTAASLHKYTVNGDKTISGNQHTINVKRNRIKIQDNHVTVEDLTLQSRLNNLPKSSIFYSDDADGVLHLKNTSFDGVQRGQVAKMQKGHIKVSGQSTFRTKGPFEVFEAKDITFMEDAEFLGETTGTGNARKEAINLFNEPTITIEPNASVILKTQGRNSVIREQDESVATIDIQGNAALQLYGDHKKTNSGKPLINFPGADSYITVGEAATFDIQNHREGRQLGELISMHGKLVMAEEGSKVAYWNQGSNIDKPSGNQYVAFPRIIKGELDFNAGKIESAHAREGSSLAESDNKEKDGKTFEEIFQNKKVGDIKRLSITAADKPQAPQIDVLTDQDDTLTGTATPGLDIEIKDASGHVWQTQADEKTGKFTVELGDRAPYKAGHELIGKATDKYGAESEEATITVVGSRLNFDVPDTLSFQPTKIKDEEIAVQRADEDWSIDILDTREAGSAWEITAQAAPLEAEDGHLLADDALVFVQDNKQQSLEDRVLIEEGVADDTNETTVSWDQNEGILLQLNPVTSGVQPHTDYTTTIEWTLTDAP